MSMQIGTYLPRKSLVVLLITLVLGCFYGCKETDASRQANGAKNSSSTQRREGDIRVAEQRKKVIPYIMHRAEMDLFVQCRLFAESGGKQGEASPLCYQPDERQQIKVLRIEHRQSMKIAQFLGFLRSSGECTHFIVDVTGTIYQTLDLAYPCRRDGAYRSGEVRVLSGHAGGHQRLKEAFSELFPGSRVEQKAFELQEGEHDE